MKKNTLQKQLSNDILMMLSASFDKWWPNAPMAHAKMLAKSAHRASTDIGTRLAESLAVHSGDLTREEWRQMAVEATRDATINVPDKPAPVRLSDNGGFADAVADCTANNVAPIGSDWSRDLEEKHAAALRASMAKFSLSKNQLDCLVTEFRDTLRQKKQTVRG